MHSKEAIYYTFNKFFYDFLEDVKNTNKEVGDGLKSHYKVKNLQTEKHLDQFVKHNTQVMFEDVIRGEVDGLLTQESLRDMYLGNSLTVGSLATHLGKDCYNTVACYIYHFVLMKLLLDFANKEEDESDVKALFNQVMQVLRHIQNKEEYEEALREILDEDIQTLLEHIDKTAAAVVEDGEQEPMDTGSLPNIPDIENSKIGSMAKEISQELNLNDLNIEKPEDVFKLMQGDALGNIIGKVGNKINQKISSGELKHDELVSEAFSMMNQMGGNNPILANLMKSMGSMKGMKGNVRVDETKIRSMSTKDRLKRKLDERKKREASA